MQTVIVRSNECNPCQQLQNEYPEVRTLDIDQWPQLGFVLQMLLESGRIPSPVVISCAVGNGKEARRLLGEPVVDKPVMGPTLPFMEECDT